MNQKKNFYFYFYFFIKVSINITMTKKISNQISFSRRFAICSITLIIVIEHIDRIILMIEYSNINLPSCNPHMQSRTTRSNVTGIALTGIVGVFR